MSITYNKLVRDKIPQTIAAAGKTPVTRIADRDECYQLLRRKLQEEVAEFLESDSIEELADIHEVLVALAAAKDCEWSEVKRIARDKRAERGGFDERIVLIEVK